MTTNRFRVALVAFLAGASLLAAGANGQPNQFGFGAGQGVGTRQAGPGGVNNGVGNGANNGGNGNAGGGAQADFDSLIDLIQSTVAVDTWADNGGAADVRPYVGGVFVDPVGTMRLAKLDKSRGRLDLIRSAPLTAKASIDPRQPSSLRYVSLPRLEREIARRQLAHEPLDESMLTLAGLRRVRYVFVYPESHDLVLAGPADDWYIASSGRVVSRSDDLSVVRLDDFVTLWRREHLSPGSTFGCSITPRQENLARTQAFLNRSSQKPLRPGGRKKWLKELQSQLGMQDIEIFDVDANTRVARVLVEADHHMKLVGMGLAEGVPGVQSYLESLPNDEAARPLGVLRWWFATKYAPIVVNQDEDAFELCGQGVGVLSETELLTKNGERVHTNQSDPLTALFAHRFTEHFQLLCERYPVYAELRNVFDLAVVCALIESKCLAALVNWRPGALLDAERLPLPNFAAPQQVESVVNHRVINRTQIVAGVSGGVMAAPGEVVERVTLAEDSDELNYHRDQSPDELDQHAWWWDAG